MTTAHASSRRSYTLAIVLLVVAGGFAGREPACAQSSAGTTARAAGQDLERLLAQLPGPAVANLEAPAGTAPQPDFTRFFAKQIVRIRMRDGVELYTEIYTPTNHAESLPIIYERTPYGLNLDSHGYSLHLRYYPELIRDGYIFAFQDSRGRGASGGEFVTGGPMRDKTVQGSTDQSTDAFDSIDWLVKNVVHNNGRVGTLGISYGGFLTMRALVDPHPALRAASPQATCADMFVGDDWHHNGAFRLSYSFDWIAQMETALLAHNSSALASITRYDSYEEFLKLGPLSNVNKTIFHGKAPSWNAFADHPNLDGYWQKEMCGVLPYIQPVSVPTLVVAGYFDAEDLYGPLVVYRQYEMADPQHLAYLVFGPWYHGSWSRSPDGRKLGKVDFEQDASRWFRDNVQARWFGYWLKDKGTLDLPRVLAFRTGENRWERYDSWPPRSQIEDKKLYLRANGALSFDAPAENGGAAHDDYVSDPAKPVPYYPRPITDNDWPEWQLADQRFVDGRPDVLTYESEPLQQDITVTGDPVAHLFAATSGSDSDWVVKLIDVYPEDYQPDVSARGFQFMLAGEVFRARYRNSFAKPEAVVPGKVTAYVIKLRDRNHTFKTGHRIMVQIQSTWFPIIDRNPQRFVPSIYEAVAADFQKATQSIYRSGRFASYLSLPVNARPVEALPASFNAH